MGQEKRSFYRWAAMLMEPWDGPALLAFSDGRYVGAILDRNGLRPARYYLTSDDHLYLSSEVGVNDIPVENIIKKKDSCHK
uniref:Glutamine amidotransferase type-2 domain-containing protein n=1 Tax=Panagrolaimus superbus TaxID=310955 RepID=A0A914Y5P0_9BILA